MSGWRPATYDEKELEARALVEELTRIERRAYAIRAGVMVVSTLVILVIR